MTALNEFARLEATGVWRASRHTQRRNVVVSLGDATLAIMDMQDTALAHWSLAAVRRENPGELPAVFSPGGDAEERLELDDDTMIAALEKVRRVVERSRPREGRLRFYLAAGIFAVLLGLSVFWLPGAMIRHTVKVVPPASRADIGAQLLDTIQRVSGRPCAGTAALEVLDTLTRRLLPDGNRRLVVLSDGVATAQHLPGGALLLNRDLIEDHEDPAPLAGYILAEDERALRFDPLERMLIDTGPVSAFGLLMTGQLDPATLESYAERLLLRRPDPLETEVLLERFRAAGVSATPYAYALDVTGESTLALIEGDPVAPGAQIPLLSDGEWVTLQGICGE